jgi:tuftelin-interacting protein 11
MHHTSGTGADDDEGGKGVAGKELDASGGSSESEADRSRLVPPKKRPRGPGDLLLGRVHFVAASAAAGPSNYRHLYPRYEHTPHNLAPSAMSSFPAPNSRVANMMRLMNYEAGSGLGKYGQGIILPIKAANRPQYHGLGTVGAEEGGQYDNGLPSSDPWWPKKWGDDRIANRSYQPRNQDSDCGDADGSRRQGRKFCEEILAKVRQQRDAALARQDQETPELFMKAVADALALIKKAFWAPAVELTAGDLIWEFTWLKEMAPELYMIYRVADVAGKVVAPLVRPMLQKWQPLPDPTLWLEVAAMLKNTMDDGSATSPYAALINNTVVPAVKVSEWKATDPDRMLRFLEPWKDMLPPSTMQRILEEVVMPELTADVESWDPRSPWDTTSCHLLLRPWVPLAGPLLEDLYPTVRRKLRDGLKGWDTDRALASNYELVSPWKDLFGPATWEEFIGEIKVLPWLAQALLDLRITPPKQKDASFGEVIMKWAPLVRDDAMVVLLERAFFDRWLHALRHWLLSAGRPAGEAMAWCRGWKRLFPPELLANERVLARLDAGVDMVNRVAEGEEIL